MLMAIANGAVSLRWLLSLAMSLGCRLQSAHPHAPAHVCLTKCLSTCTAHHMPLPVLLQLPSLLLVMRLRHHVMMHQQQQHMSAR